MSKPEKAPRLGLSLPILGYREDGEWVALALEMDLRGYGETFDEAAQDLADLVTGQLSFALQKGEPELIYHPAEPVYWRMHADVQREKLSAFARGTSRDSELRVAGMPLPSPNEIAERAGEYQHT
jgi:hypothetical protein